MDLVVEKFQGLGSRNDNIIEWQPVVLCTGIDPTEIGRTMAYMAFVEPIEPLHGKMRTCCLTRGKRRYFEIRC